MGGGRRRVALRHLGPSRRHQFLDIGNQYILAGAQYDPQVLAGLSARQIASQLGDPSSPVAQAIDGPAQVSVGAIDHVLHDHAADGPA